MARVAGVIKVRLNGVDYRTKEGATLTPGGHEKTSHYASNKRTGTSRKPIGSKISVTFELMNDTDTQAIQDFEGIAEYVTDTGQVWAAPNSETMMPIEITGDGGGIKVEIEGDEAKLVT